MSVFDQMKEAENIAENLYKISDKLDDIVHRLGTIDKDSDMEDVVDEVGYAIKKLDEVNSEIY